MAEPIKLKHSNIPDFFNPKLVRKLFIQPWGTLAQVAHQKSQARCDADALNQVKITALGIDVQVSFTHAIGELPVLGAPEDVVRAVQFIYKNIYHIPELVLSIDVHNFFQIFHPGFFLCEKDGALIAPNTQLTYEDLKNGRYYVNPQVGEMLLQLSGGAVDIAEYFHYLNEYSLHYLKELEKKADDTDGPMQNLHTIWSHHCIKHSIGAALNPLFHEMVAYHSHFHGVEPTYIEKGQAMLSESFSPAQSEVLTDQDGHFIGEVKLEYFESLLKENQALFVFGQAGSHCVLSMLLSLIEISKRLEKMELLEKVYILQDCMSPVVIPDVIDFTVQQQRGLEYCQKHGMNIVNSEMDLCDMPGILGEIFVR